MSNKKEQHKIEIDGCANCPFKYYIGFLKIYGCHIDIQDRDIRSSKSDNPITPRWCPLKQKDVLLTFKK